MPEYPSGQDLAGHDLAGADLRHANLTGHDLSGANLTGADLRGANLAGVNLSRADLTGANLQGANLSGADLTGAISRDTIWPEGFNPEPVIGTDTLGPTFTVMVEGAVYAWDANTISVPEIRALGSLPADRPVVQLELAGGEDFGPVSERPLKEDEVHQLFRLEPGKASSSTSSSNEADRPPLGTTRDGPPMVRGSGLGLCSYQPGASPLPRQLSDWEGNALVAAFSFQHGSLLTAP